MKQNTPTPKNRNKEIVCKFLEGKMELSYEDAFKQFFDVEAHKVIRPDAFRFYHKKVKAGEIDLTKLDEKPVVEPPAEDSSMKAIISRNSKSPAPPEKPSEAAIKKAVEKTKVVKAAAI